MEFPQDLHLKIKEFEYQLQVSEKIAELKRIIKCDILTTFYLGKHEHKSVSFQVSYFKRTYQELVSCISESTLIFLVTEELALQRRINNR